MKGQLLSGRGLESGRNIWTASGKSHPASRKPQTQPSQFGYVTTLDVNCFVGAGRATVSLYLPYQEPARTDALTSTDRVEGHPLMIIHHKTQVYKWEGKFYVTVFGQTTIRCKRWPFAYSQHKAGRCREWSNLLHKMAIALQLGHSTLESVSSSAMLWLSAPETWVALRSASHTSPQAHTTSFY